MAVAPTIDFSSTEGNVSNQPTAQSDNAPSVDFAALERSGEPNAPPLGKKTGLLSNIGARINDQIANIAGLPVDLATAGLNRFIEGANSYAEQNRPKTLSSLIVGRGSDDTIPEIKNPIGGSESIKRAMGYIGANPDDVVPANAVERVAGDIAGGVASFAVPGIAAEGALARFGEGMSPVVKSVAEGVRGGASQPETGLETLKNVARNARAGAVYTAGSDAAESVTPDAYKPYVGLAGGLVAGMGEAYFSHVLGHLMAPKTVENEAANRFRSGISDPDAVSDALKNPPQPLPGAPLYTTGQATNDSGILQMENWDRNQRPDVYRDKAADQNKAQVNALQSVQPVGDPSAVGRQVTDRLNKIDSAYGAVEDSARQHAMEVLERIGGLDAPETYGATGRQAISAVYQPQIDALDQSAFAAQQGRSDALAQAPGQQYSDILGGSTALQQHGQNLRQFIQEGRNARAAEEGRLWDIVRQNGDLALDHRPVSDAVDQAVSSMQPAGGDRLTPSEQQLYGTIKQWDAPQPLDVMRAMRSNIGDAADTAYRAGDRQAAARLRAVRSGIDQSIENGVTDRATQESNSVQQGALDPDQTVGASLARDAQNFIANRQVGQRPAAGVANRGRNPGTNLAGGSPILSGAVAPAGAPRAGPGNPGIDPAVAGSPAISPEELAAQYGQARAATRETHRIFDDTPAGNVIARGPYGAPEALPASQVFSQFWNSGKHAPEDLANYAEATRNSPQARQAMVDAAAFDLRKSAVRQDGSINVDQLRKWTAKNQDKLLAMPEVASSFENAATAQGTLDAITAQRQALAERYQKAIGPTDATMMGQYWKPGASGGDGVKQYMAETGGTPNAVEALINHAASTLRGSSDVPITPQRYALWKNRFANALNELPAEVRSRFDTAADAQKEVQDAAARRAEAADQYQKSAAGLLMRADDPVAAVNQAMRSNAGQQNMRFLASQVRGDAEAEAGLRRAVVEVLMDRAAPQGIAGKEAGNSGTDWVKNQTFRNVLDQNRAAITEVMTPRQMQTLDRIAESLKITDRSVSGSRPPVGPGTARDLIANQKYGSVGQKATTLLSAVASGSVRVGSIVAGHYLGGLEGSLIGSAITGAVGAVRGTSKSSISTAREAEVVRLIQAALEDPSAAQLLLTKVRPERAPFVLKSLLNRVQPAP